LCFDSDLKLKAGHPGIPGNSSFKYKFKLFEMKNAKHFVFLTVLAVTILSFNACKKEAVIPALTTDDVSGITLVSATAGGNITSDGDSDVTARGVCWNTMQNPDLNSSKTSDGTGSGSFISEITGLTSGTKYYIRAYATNSAGTGYGNEIEFTTNPVLPATLTTSPVSKVTLNTAVSGGRITSSGGGEITEKGVCWSLNQNPTIDDSRTVDGTGASNFGSNLSGLDPGTTYYLRAYATNSAGTSYGEQISFSTDTDISPAIFNPDLTYGTVTDIDGNTYKTIQIGTQVWMAENLKTTRYKDEEDIPLVTGNLDWSNLTTHGFSWYDDSPQFYKDVYGALYNWYAVTSGKLCPEGWHVFTETELGTLILFLGNGTDIGSLMKETGTSHWELPNPSAANESGWTGLPGGRRNGEGAFTSNGFVGYWWTATEFSSTEAVDAMLYYDFTFLDSYNFSKTNGMSVRCVKD